MRKIIKHLRYYHLNKRYGAPKMRVAYSQHDKNVCLLKNNVGLIKIFKKEYLKKLEQPYLAEDIDTIVQWQIVETVNMIIQNHKKCRGKKFYLHRKQKMKMLTKYLKEMIV